VRIVNFRAENFKRLQAVEITPDGNMVVIAGNNDQGKSSVLDAIMAAISGGKGMKDIPEPIRRGENFAEVVVDLGELRIRRVWEPGKHRVEVFNADGQKFSSPQSILDALTGSLTFDPLEFARMAPRDQRATLLRLVDLGFDIDENDKQRVTLVQAETTARAAVKSAEQTVERLVAVPADTPDAEIPASDIVAEMQRRDDAIKANNKKRSEHAEARNVYRQAEVGVAACEDNIRRLEKELADARADLTILTGSLEKKRAAGEQLKAEVDALVDPDIAEMTAKLATLDETNRNVRQKIANAGCRTALKDARAKLETASKAVKVHDYARAKALGAAEFPVDGLRFSEDGVTLNGLPFAQASESQRIKTSVAMGMAMNPRLKVILIRDGSSLDNNRMKEIAEMAAWKDFQLWVETIHPGTVPYIEIIDGAVKGGESA